MNAWSRSSLLQTSVMWRD
jgi:hypothetical protein